ncbi:hypothetical protein EVAR_82763_1 [Eumeta japonica]|uniref:Uncharacterized protein n=1 Tax=Eumeta variegata TaxID=151549 RepID=A0A4C1UMS4_EUMVA|nr:hypothetical protein EVAR_82763_1 [Eumeta japonica]
MGSLLSVVDMKIENEMKVRRNRAESTVQLRTESESKSRGELKSRSKPRLSYWNSIEGHTISSRSYDIRSGSPGTNGGPRHLTASRSTYSGRPPHPLIFSPWLPITNHSSPALIRCMSEVGCPLRP